MEFSRQYLTRLSQESNFIKDALEKVLRLSEILKFLNSDVVFKDKLALKGGTAINLTAVELPRLSVDIDLDFTVNVSRDDLPEIKEKFKKRLTDYMWQEGYSLADSRDHFALTSFLFNYINNAGNRDRLPIRKQIPFGVVFVIIDNIKKAYRMQRLDMFTVLIENRTGKRNAAGLSF